MTQTNYETAMAQFKLPKPADDIDLVKEVRDILLSGGLHAAVAANFDTNRFIIEAQGKISPVQRHLLNRYWTMQLMYSSKPTTEERYCLIPDGQVTDWLRLFKDKVFPFVLENHLPVKI